MEVILLDNVETLGSRGQIVKVANGYGRNYLLPRKMAIAATPQNRKWIEQQRARFLKLEARERGESEELAKLMEGVTVVATRRSGEKGQLFGSVTAIDIEEGLAAQGYKISRRKIHLGSPLKSIGEFDVPVRLHRDVTITVKVRVETEGEPEVNPESEVNAEAAAAQPADAPGADADAKAEAESGETAPKSE
ncbi:MAG: 50S ribosomal protein L9 [Acidobacteria bacterium]|nr:MAG: 50S ribosomal protein L9 [Acidobacteriota bacterium]